MKSETRRKLSVFVFMFLFVGAILAYAETLSPTLLDFPSGTLNIDTINLGGVSRDTWPAGEAGANHDQDLNTTDAVTFASVDTGQGANELYDMDQNVLTTSSPTFDELSARGISVDWIDLDTNRSKWPTGSGGGRGAYDFIVYNESLTYYAEYPNGTLLCSGSDADQIINWVLRNVSDIRYGDPSDEDQPAWQATVILIGFFPIDAPIIMESHIHLKIIGIIYLLDGADCNMIEFEHCHPHASLRDFDWTISGGLLDGNRDQQSDTTRCGIYFAPKTSLSGSDYHTTMIIEEMRFRNIIGSAIKAGNDTELTATIEHLVIRKISSRWCTQTIDLYKNFGGCSVFDLLWCNSYGTGTTVYMKSCANMRMGSWYISGCGNYGWRTEGCNEIQSDKIFVDAGGNALPVVHEGLKNSIIDNTYIRHTGLTPTTTPAMRLQDGLGWESVNNTITGVHVTRAGWGSTNDFKYVIEEIDSSDFNTYSMINGRNTTTATLKLVGINNKIDFDTISPSDTTGIAIDVPDDFVNARSISVPFVIGTTSTTHVNIGGWNLTSSGNTAFTSITLPSGISEVLRITVYAVSWTTETHSMRLEIKAWGSQSSEVYASEAFIKQHEPSITTEIATYDRVYWRFINTDDETDTDMDDWLPYETIHIMVRHEAAGGDDCATNGVFQTVLIEYV